MESRYTWKNQLLLGLKNFAVIGGAIVLLSYLVIISDRAAKEELEGMFVDKTSEITSIAEPVVYGYEDGAKIWELRSQSAEEESETESSDLTRIYELILFKGGDENILIRGDKGHWDKPHEKLTMNGNVEVESADGTTFLDTEVLIWEEQSKTLICPEFVDFWVEDNHVIANSLYSADDLATIDFIGDVEMFVVGLEGENFVTREGDFPIEDIEDERESDGMYVLAKFVHYDKGDKLADCYPVIPLEIQNKYSIDHEGRQKLEENYANSRNMIQWLSNPEYVDALQRSISEMDLTDQEMAFLKGDINSLEQQWNADTSSPAGDETDESSNPMGVNLGSGFSSGPVFTGDAAELPNPDAGSQAAELPGLIIETDLPIIPARDPEVIYTTQDYDYITDWEISPNLEAELYENDPGFDPHEEYRDGLVFCYRFDRKMWAEEIHIDLGDHIIDALRHVDGRFRNLEDKDREPPEGRAARHIQKSPTQMISNYLRHNWRDNVTEGYGRVLALQDQKDTEADNIVYYEDSDMMQAWGNVITHQFSGNWWRESGALEDIDDDRAREDVQNPSTMTSDALLSYSNNVTWAFGNVVFRQEKQTVFADRGQYEEETEILVMAGNVDYSNEDGELLSCALLTMDTKYDEYIAEGAAIARNIVPDEYRDNLDEFKKDEDERGPDDDARTRLLQTRTALGLGDWTEEAENPPSPPPIEMLDQLGREIPPRPPPATIPFVPAVPNIEPEQVTDPGTSVVKEEDSVTEEPNTVMAAPDAPENPLTLFGIEDQAGENPPADEPAGGDEETKSGQG